MTEKWFTGLTLTAFRWIAEGRGEWVDLPAGCNVNLWLDAAIVLKQRGLVEFKGRMSFTMRLTEKGMDLRRAQNDEFMVVLCGGAKCSVT